MVTGRKRYRAIRDYTTDYPVSIFFEEGEQVRVGRDFTDDPAWENWVRCYGTGGREAWCPKQYLDIEGETGTFLRFYDARELSVHVGEILEIGEELNGFGYAANREGSRGWVPLKCLEPVVPNGASTNRSGGTKDDEE